MVEFVDFPVRLVPANLKVRAASSRIEGGLTRGGVAYASPEPGGRWVVDLSYSYLRTAGDSRLFGWLLDEMDAGTVLRVTIGQHVETIGLGDLGLADAPLPYVTGGVPSFHSDGTGLAVVGTARSVGETLEGSISMVIDMGGYGRVLKIGHLIGCGHFINRIRSIAWDGDVATIGLRMPWPATIPDDAIIRLTTLKMLVQADRAAAQSMRTLHEYGLLTQPGSVTLMEYRG